MVASVRSSSPSDNVADIAVVDVASTLDEGDFTPLQRLIVLLIILTIVMDGVDNQLFSYAIPHIVRDWKEGWANFTVAMSAGPIGMILGSLISGYLADQIGRRLLILATLALSGVTTFLLGFASSPNEMIIWRFLTGCGIGGALPVCTTLAAEFSPLRYRTMVVTISIVCVPLGGMFAGLISNPLLDHFGWQTSFFVGGILPLGLLLLLWFTLPESPRFLSQNPEYWPTLRHLLKRLRRPVDAHCHFIDRLSYGRNLHQKEGFPGLFRDGRAFDSTVLCLSFFFCMIAIYGFFYWLPTMLVMANVEIKIAHFGLVLYNMGGVIGSLLCGLAISSMGSRRALGICTSLGALSVFALMLVDVGVQGHSILLLGLIGVHGLFVNAVQSTLYALPAHLYPTSIRATGTASAAACGRFGAIIVSSSGLFFNQITYYFLAIGIALLCLFGLLLILRRHIPAIGLRKTDRPEAVFE